MHKRRSASSAQTSPAVRPAVRYENAATEAMPQLSQTLATAEQALDSTIQRK